jgi:hypothetical protein
LEKIIADRINVDAHDSVPHLAHTLKELFVNICLSDINVCIRKDYAEMFSSHLLSTNYVCLQRIYVFLFICSKWMSRELVFISIPWAELEDK